MAMDVCICCGCRVNGNYRFCRGCEGGRSGLHDDCIATGMSEKSAMEYVESMFPCCYCVSPYADRLSHAGYKFNGKSWVRNC